MRNCTEHARHTQKYMRNILDNRGIVAREFYLHYLWEILRERLKILNLVGFGTGMKLRLNALKLKLNGKRDEIKLIRWFNAMKRKTSSTLINFNS